MNEKKPHFLLLHGSWMGGWSWDAVRAELEAQGIASTAPTLAGLDPRAQPDPGSISLSTHIDEALGHVDRLCHAPVIVVGHSYGALVAAAVADRRPDLVRKLIVLDGFLPEHGKSAFDLRPDLAGVLRGLVLSEVPDCIQVPPAQVLGLDDSPAMKAVAEQMRAMPLGTHAEALTLTGVLPHCARHYVLFEQCPFFLDTARVAATHGWSISRIDAPHLAILTHPAAVACVLSEAMELTHSEAEPPAKATAD